MCKGSEGVFGLQVKVGMGSVWVRMAVGQVGSVGRSLMQTGDVWAGMWVCVGGRVGWV